MKSVISILQTQHHINKAIYNLCDSLARDTPFGSVALKELVKAKGFIADQDKLLDAALGIPKVQPSSKQASEVPHKVLPDNDMFVQELDFDKIIWYRRSIGLNQSDFWKLFGVTQSGGSRYENGRAIPASTKLLLQLVATGVLPASTLCKFANNLPALDAE